MARTDPQMVIRLPAELKEWLSSQAAQNHRSQNGEIVNRLEESRQKEIQCDQRRD